MGVENLEHSNGSVGGVIGLNFVGFACFALPLTLASQGASLSRLGKLYFGRGYREDCVIGLILMGFAPHAVASSMLVGYLSRNE